MRAVKGSVVSSRPVSFSKAAAILARFAAAENGARPETAAYLRRASTAFDELVQFHREIKAARRRPEIQVPREEEEDGGRDGFKEKKRRKKKEERVGLEDGDERVALEGLRGEIGAVDGGDLMVDERKHGGGDKFELEERRDEKRKKKKKRKRGAEEEGKNNLERKEEQVDEERHGKNKKKRKKNKEKGGEKRKEFE